MSSMIYCPVFVCTVAQYFYSICPVFVCTAALYFPGLLLCTSIHNPLQTCTHCPVLYFNSVLLITGKATILFFVHLVSNKSALFALCSLLPSHYFETKLDNLSTQQDQFTRQLFHSALWRSVTISSHSEY